MKSLISDEEVDSDMVCLPCKALGYGLWILLAEGWFHIRDLSPDTSVLKPQNSC